MLTLPDRTFGVSLSDEQFNRGLFGLDEGEKYGAVVQATVKQIGSSYVSVPDNGSTAMLVGLSLLIIASASKRRVIC
jgi:VPDSG-CTERM motif